MNICKICGKEYDKTKNKLNFCDSCRYSKTKHPCQDCSTLVDKRATRCRPCDGKTKMYNSHPRWTGGRRRTQQGYVLLTDQVSREHPNAQPKGGGLLEHIAVLTKELGRPLIEGENVHHKNGVKDDNRPENLELWSTSQPSGQRVEDKLTWAHELIAFYEWEQRTHQPTLS